MSKSYGKENIKVKEKIDEETELKKHKFCSCQYNCFDSFYEWFYKEIANLDEIESSGLDIIDYANDWAINNYMIIKDDGIYNLKAKCNGSCSD